jgi:hypothetical protein
MTVNTADAGAVRGILRRMLGAARLDAAVYEEVEADQSATGQAFLVVLLASTAAGIGGVSNHGATGVLWHAIHGVILWYLWAYITYFVGTRWLPTRETEADHGELLRTIGFSSAPGVLRVFGLVTPIAGAVFLVCTLWMLAAMIMAVRQALDYQSTARAVAVCAIGFPVYALGLMVSILLLGPWPI